jgi:hypothetical protein
LLAVALQEYTFSFSSPRTTTGLAAAVPVLIVAPLPKHVTVNPVVAEEPEGAETLKETVPSAVFVELTIVAAPGAVAGGKRTHPHHMLRAANPKQPRDSSHSNNSLDHLDVRV